MTSLLVVSVGTDHHRFDRLSDWVEGWLEDQGSSVDCVYQEGASRAPHGAMTLGIVPREDMLRHMRAAEIIVTQAGPGSIKDAHAAGQVPIVVPRLRSLGEAVDDHQVAFARSVAALGWVVLAETEGALRESLDAALAHPESTRWQGEPDDLADVVERFASFADEVTRRPIHRIRWQRVPQAIRLARVAIGGGQH